MTALPPQVLKLLEGKDGGDKKKHPNLRPGKDDCPSWLPQMAAQQVHPTVHPKGISFSEGTFALLSIDYWLRQDFMKLDVNI